jgi:hypothetical protein
MAVREFQYKTNRTNTGCPKNGVLTVHYDVEEITVNDRECKKKLLDLFANLAIFESGT